MDKIIYEDLKNVEKELKDEKNLFKKNMRLKKNLIIIYSLILLFIVAFFVFEKPFNYFLNDNNSVFLEKEINYGSYKIIFTENILNELKSLYQLSEKNGREYVACLDGSFFNKTYNINTIFIPIVYENTFKEVVYKRCDSLILYHTHPFNSCFPSNQDLETFSSMKENSLMIIGCKADKIYLHKKS